MEKSWLRIQLHMYDHFSPLRSPCVVSCFPPPVNGHVLGSGRRHNDFMLEVAGMRHCVRALVCDGVSYTSLILELPLGDIPQLSQQCWIA
jgi:hypothetical protein